MARKRHIEVTNVWDDRILRSEKAREKYIKRARTLVQMYVGKQWVDRAIKFPDKATCNLIFPHIKTQLPSLYFQNPKFFVRATRRGYDDNAALAQLLLNNNMKHQQGKSFKRHARAAILDAFFAFGCIKTGYAEEIETNPQYGKPLVKGMDGDTPIYDIDDKTGAMRYDTEEDVISSQKFFSRRTSPGSLLFDLDADNFFEEGRYIIQEIHRPLVDVKKDLMYDKVERTKLEASYAVKGGLKLSGKDYETKEYGSIYDDLQMAVLYEIYDLESDKLKTICKGHDRFLRNEKMPDGIDGHPYSFLIFNEIPDELYPLPEIEPLKGIQEDYNIAKTMVAAHAKRFGRKYGYIKSQFATEDDIDRIENGEDGVMFEVKELPLKGKVIEALEDATLDPSVYQWLMNSREDFREAGGSSEMERGQVERRKTAFEASKISEGIGVRKEDRRSLVEDFLADAGTKMLKSMQANLSETEIERLAPERKTEWIAVTADQIRGDLVTEVEAGSTAPKIPELERQDILMLLQAMVQMPPQALKWFEVYLNFEQLTKSLIKSFNTLDETSMINDAETQKQIKERQAKEEALMKQMEMTKVKGQAGLIPGEEQPMPMGGTGNAPV